MQEATSSSREVMACLDACVASLLVVTANDMPKEVANDDFILSILAAVKNHLLVNVLAAVHLRAGHGQSSEAGESADLSMFMIYVHC